MNIIDLISQNPFRVLGIHSSASAKEIQKNISKSRAYIKIGKEPSFEYDFNFLNFSEVVRNEEVISKLENKILLDTDKFKYALFWFINSSTIDAVAINNLVQGNVDKAVDIWTKAVEGKSLGSKNYTACNNLSTLLMYKTLNSTKTDQFLKGDKAILDLRKAISLKITLLKSPYLERFFEEITKSKQCDSLLFESFFEEKIIEILNTNYEPNDLIKLFSGMSTEIKTIFDQQLVNEPIRKINDCIKTANEDLEKDHSNGLEIGKKLIKDTFKEIKSIKDLVGKENYEYQLVANKLANLIMQCGILFFNATLKYDTHYEFLSSYKYAKTIATDSKTIQRGSECIKHCEEGKDAALCMLCSENDLDENTSFKVKMHRMQFGGSYNYFKDGGLPVSCCKQCKNKALGKKVLAFIIPSIIFSIAIALTGGIYIFIELFFIRLMLLKGTYKFFNKIIFYNSVKSHPTLIQAENEGYTYGMPNQPIY